MHYQQGKSLKITIHAHEICALQKSGGIKITLFYEQFHHPYLQRVGCHRLETITTQINQEISKEQQPIFTIPRNLQQETLNKPPKPEYPIARV